MTVRIPTIYLVGAIRDDHTEDIVWRAQAIEGLAGKAVFLNPIGGKTFNAATRAWTMSGIDSTAGRIVKHDFWCVTRADIVLANMTSLSEGYPSIGSLLELGRATGTGALLYLILDPSYTGHQNAGMYRLHPFLAEIAAAVFDTTEAAISFLRRHLDVLSGQTPHFGDVTA